MDNPLVEFGGAVYQPKEPINCTYDMWGAPAGFLRGLFEYVYAADALTLYPQLPPAITEIQQRIPVRFGSKQIYLATSGVGPITEVLINGKPLSAGTPQTVRLAYDALPDTAFVSLGLGGAPARKEPWPTEHYAPPAMDTAFWQVPGLTVDPAPAGKLLSSEVAAGRANGYAAKHAELVVRYVDALHTRADLKAARKLVPLATEAANAAADKAYIDTVSKLLSKLPSP